MQIHELIRRIEHIALKKMEGIQSFYVGNVWNMSAGKGDIYRCLWFETPVLVEYKVSNKLTKQFSFSIDILDIPKLDDTNDEMDKISKCEALADEFLWHLTHDVECCKDFTLVDLPTGLSVKSINSDIACGIRLDIKVNTGRICPKSC